MRTLPQLDDVIVVDDGSTDGTAAALADLPLTLISNPANLGKGASLWRGFAARARRRRRCRRSPSTATRSIARRTFRD